MEKIQKWLFCMLCLIATMVIIGGITRLTGSGLSMVDWQPIMGIFPPITDSQWQDAFNSYKTSPEYQKINKGMSLSSFKFIFFWEYIHRILGRIIGLVALIPWAYFLLKGKLEKKFSLFWALIIMLIGLQGGMGWYMVKSGLVDNPEVSHYRLAAHLGLALIIFTLILWQYLKVKFPSTKKLTCNWILLSYSISILIGIQIVYGAFMAGLKAGYFFNTFPKMNNSWFPSDLVVKNNIIYNLVENVFIIQWIHRWLAVIIVIIGFIIWNLCKKQTNNPYLQYSGLLLLTAIGFQFFLGVVTLLTKVWLPVAAMHQFGGLLLIVGITLVIYFSKNSIVIDNKGNKNLS